MMHAAQGAPASTIDLSRIPLDDLILLHALKSKQDEPATLVELSPQLREPHDEQRRFLDSPAKRKVIRAGRRGGKTTGVAILAARAFAAGRRVLYGCPTQDQTDKFWYEVCTIFAADIARGTLIKNETRRMIERRGTEQRLRCKTCFNADTLRGDYCDQLILDEYQLMHEDAWQQVGAPMLLDNDGDACFIYTPPSRRTRHLSRADDPRHASKLYAQAEAHQAAGGERWAAFHFTSHANPHISRAALAELAQDMTRASMLQEIDAQEVDDVAGAQWTRKLLDDTRVVEVPELRRIVVGVDPSGSTTGDACGIVVCGKSADGHGYVLDDRTIQGSPHTWATEAVATFHRWKCDRLVAEVNYGGEMCAEVIRGIAGAPSVEMVNATRGKQVRAEPIAARFEDGRAHLVGSFAALEDELVSFDGTGKSPNRLDAMVWAMTELRLAGGMGVYV
jgi:hypothetical protein